MNYSVVKEVEMAESTRLPGQPVPGRTVPGREGPGRRPRIVRQRGVAGLWETAYSQLYRLLLLVVPVR